MAGGGKNMKKTTKISLAIIIISIVVILVACTFIYYYYSIAPCCSAEPYPGINFAKVNDTLIVTVLQPQGITNSDLVWENVGVVRGNATLPTGHIDIEDVITNCSGYVELVWKPYNLLFWTGDFSKL